MTDTPRSVVYEVIDGERDYQEERWNKDTTASGGRHTVPEFILYMEHYLTLARTASSTQADPAATIASLDMLRKVTALGVACMEQNGVVLRRRA